MYCKIRRLNLLRTGQSSDCELHVRYTNSCTKRCYRQFRCHKIMLASASEEFARIINDPNFLRNKRIIYVDDASIDAYETLLLYIYTYEIYNDTNIDMCGDIIYLANKYKMPDLIEGYIGKLSNQTWPMTTVLQIFQMAKEYNTPAIMQVVQQKIEPVAKQLLAENSYLKLSVKELHALMIILKSTGLVSDNELLLALKKYQICNYVHYGNMSNFQQFVEVTQLFDNVLFESDGMLAVEEPEPQNEDTEMEPEPEWEQL